MSRPSTRTSHPHVDPWATCASRAAHPSTQAPGRTGIGDPASLFESIAAGLADVTVPFDLRPEGAGAVVGVLREQLLVTPAYEVWVMGWPIGAAIQAHAHDGIVAIAVVNGELTESRPALGAVPTVRHRPAGSVWSLVAGHPHALAQHGDRPATTIHVHQR